MATALQLIQKFETMVDDELDQDFELQLLNDAKNAIESDYTWEILKKKDLSQTATKGDTSAVTHNLPTDMAFPLKLQMLTDRTPYNLVAFEDQYMYQDTTRNWFMDLLNGKYAFTGTIGLTDTIVFMYQAFTADLAIGGTWSFPSRFHDILPYKMAQLYYAVDAGEKGRSWDDRWTLYYNYRLQQMQLWDAKLKEQAKTQAYYDSNSNPLVAF
jgi:hypothetical protein